MTTATKNLFAQTCTRYKVSQREIIRDINEHSNGMSRSPLQALMNDGKWPKPATVEKLRNSLNRLLKNKASQEEIEGMFNDAPKSEKKDTAVYQNVINAIDKFELTQTLASEVLNKAGVRISVASVNQIFLHGCWPKTKDEEEIKTIITDWLISYDSKLTKKKLWEEIGSNALNKKNRLPAKSTPRKEKTIIDFDNVEPEMLSSQTLKHFGLNRHPFENDIKSKDDVYMGQQQYLIREAMHQVATDGGILAIVGECGAGKSEVRKYFLDHISNVDDNVKVVEPMVIDKTRLTTEMIFDAIADELMLPGVRIGLERRARQVNKALKQSSKAGVRHVLIIEEAHDLPQKAIKYLKRIWELSDGYRNMVGIILVGQPELKNTLSPQNHEVREFTRRCSLLELAPLGIELPDYISHKFKRCGANYKSIISEDAIAALKTRLQGKVSYGQHRKQQMQDMSYPLIVNNFLVNAMNLAAQLNEKIITPEVIEEL